MEAEKEELTWLLTSGVLGRSNHLARMLTFICEKRFQGQEDQVKEYTIAVEALGRRSDFDPQIDTIVRVTAHSLRKRLQEIYRNGGAGHAVHILIPPGHYIPSFLHKEVGPERHFEGTAVAETAPEALPAMLPVAQPPSPRHRDRMIGLAAAVLVVSLMLLVVLFGRRSESKAVESLMPAPPAALPIPANTIRALMGPARKAYVDRSGNTWTSGRYCTGGEKVALTDRTIGGTEDPYLYLGGIRGMAHCVFPVKPGMYEIHLHFAETTNLPPATRQAIFSLNSGPDIGFDVVDNAGGDNIATSFVATGVRLENDGAIHLDYTSEISLLNAVEILPSPSEQLLPVRFTASPAAFIDADHQTWLSDRYFSGGRRGQRPDQASIANRGIYSYDRIGRFHYTIPVVPNEKYRVRLFFSEPWFGKHNGAAGGPGSRVFDVSCNGNIVLKNFDIMAEGGSHPVVKTLEHVEATPRGNIELDFLPVLNYPLVNAIEVVPE